VGGALVCAARWGVDGIHLSGKIVSWIRVYFAVLVFRFVLGTQTLSARTAFADRTVILCLER